MNWYFLGAAAASFFTFAVHTFVGGPAIAGPLLEASDLKKVPKFTNYYCWHLVTIVLFAMGGAFAWAAYFPEGIELGWLSFLLAVSFMVWNLIMIVKHQLKLMQFPQWILFLGISIFAAPGLA
ncbi:MAG: hypothetical protein COB37_10195 [Kordiimonadales bacterium]|nr:MAG: hypothetical protein COB37_10195 [Kordiimonadales bacterium]